MPKLELFLSHRTTEARFADLIKARLEEDFFGIINLFCSTDITSVPVGAEWDERLLDGLRRAKAMLALCSNQSVKLPWINFEIGGAATRGVEIMPLCHSGVTPGLLPASVKMKQAVTLTSGKDLERWYVKLSELIGCRVPRVDFEALAGQFRELEKIYEHELNQEAAATARRTTDRSVRNPHVVCVTSRQYRDLGLANEIQMVLDAFPKLLRHDTVMSSGDLKRVLSSAVEIVHIAAYVCPRSGTLYFSAMQLPEGLSQPEGEEDRITADALNRLLRHAGTKLVVIASGDSLALIMRLLPVVHVISPKDRISASQMARWVKEFYELLWTHTLAEACDIATSQSGATMQMMSKAEATDGASAAKVDTASADGRLAVEAT
jgi:TIR domain